MAQRTMLKRKMSRLRLESLEAGNPRFGGTPRMTTVIPNDAQTYIANLLASQAVLKIKRGDLECLYRLGYVEGGLRVFDEMKKALAK